MVAQGATSRLLFAMARDRQLPSFLAKVSPKHAVPTNAVFLVAALSLVLGLTLWFTREAEAINDLGRLVNFGALVAFIVLHVTVFWWYVVRNGSRDWVRHMILPALGLGMLIFVVINQKIFAQLIGGIWVLIGVVVATILVATKRTPMLAGMSEETTVDPDDNLTAAP